MVKILDGFLNRHTADTKNWPPHWPPVITPNKGHITGGQCGGGGEKKNLSNSPTTTTTIEKLFNGYYTPSTHLLLATVLWDYQLY